MAEAEEKSDTNHVTPHMNDHPRDLLQRFISGNHFPRKFKETAGDEEEEIELSLGLSMNGRFGLDPKRANELSRLSRSSSISDFMLTKDNSAAACAAPPMAYSPLIRTCSLPAETGEQWRKRKELQSLRRMEAKRKRLEKLKNVKTVRDPVSVEANCQENVHSQSQGSVSINGTRGAVTISAQGSESKSERGRVMVCHPSQPSSQGSIGSQGTSQGTGSSGIYESESQPTQGMNRCTEAKSAASIQSLPKQNEQKSVKFAGAATENPSVEVTVDNDNKAKEMIMRNITVDMPCVSARGVGPNGKRIEGFLYRYRKGEEVSIVCVCHGTFLSPAEFVKHAGVDDVAHPLKHIVVSPSSLL